MKCTLQIHLGQRWVDCAEFEVPDAWVSLGGQQGGGRLYYLDSYLVDHLGARDARALSAAFPVGTDFIRLSAGSGWPAILFDFLPAGAARRTSLRRLGIEQDSFQQDWPLLLAGGGNPPGNLRIKEAAALFPPVDQHTGFLRQAVLDRGVDFVEYAERMGAPVAGTSGAQGDAPKFLLVEDQEGRWHAEGAVSESRVARHWLVKFPRGPTERDRLILQNEAAYSSVAQAMGLDVYQPSFYEAGALFVTRFDRGPRRGLESLAALAGLRDANLGVRHEKLIQCLVEVSSDPRADVLEYVRRDILNMMLGNTDNHARNSSLIKDERGGIRLSPLYDFAPMFWDPQMIPRAVRWSSEYSGPQGSLIPLDWAVVVAAAEKAAGLKRGQLRQAIREWIPTLKGVIPALSAYPVSPEIIELRTPDIQAHLRQLEAL